MKIAAKAGIDGVLVDGMEGGTGVGLLVALNHLGIPTHPALVQAPRALEKMGLKDQVSLIVSGGIKDDADVAKVLALDADAVTIGTGAMVAIGCIVCLQCHKGVCPHGIVTQREDLGAKLNSELPIKLNR